ncbi:MAG: hypothetical protein U1E87_06680 [Alphaproteobacteria bacterium]
MTQTDANTELTEPGLVELIGRAMRSRTPAMATARSMSTSAGSTQMPNTQRHVALFNCSVLQNQPRTARGDRSSTSDRDRPGFHSRFINLGGQMERAGQPTATDPAHGRQPPGADRRQFRRLCDDGA